MIAITKDVWEKIKPRLEQEEVFIDGVYQSIDDTLLIKKTISVDIDEKHPSITAPEDSHTKNIKT